MYFLVVMIPKFQNSVPGEEHFAWTVESVYHLWHQCIAFSSYNVKDIIVSPFRN